MFEKLRQFFSRESLGRLFRGRASGGAGPDELNLEELYQNLVELVTRNKVKLAENEDRISRVEADCKREEKSIRDISHDILKRCTLRQIRVLRKRVKRLGRISTIYNDNITLQESLIDRLENMRVQGLKTVTPEMLEDIALDCEEMYKQHRDTVATVEAMVDGDLDFGEDPDLKDLAEELGVEL